MPDNEEKNPREATEFSETLHRHGDPDPEKWDEAETVTGRPNDTPLRGVDTPALRNSTLGSRAGKGDPLPAEPTGDNSTLASRSAARKQVGNDSEGVQDKAVTSKKAAKK